MAKIKKAKPSEVADIEDARALKEAREEGTVLTGLPGYVSSGDETVTLNGVSLTGITLTPRGFGYEVKFLVPLTEEDKLPALRRTGFQLLADLTLTPSDALSWADDGD